MSLTTFSPASFFDMVVNVSSRLIKKEPHHDHVSGWKTLIITIGSLSIINLLFVMPKKDLCSIDKFSESQVLVDLDLLNYDIDNLVFNIMAAKREDVSQRVPRSQFLTLESFDC